MLSKLKKIWPKCHCGVTPLVPFPIWNTDVAICRDGNVTYYYWPVLRNSNGDFVAAKSDDLALHVSIFEAETLL